ncbi:MAG: P35 family lipoprotein [Clostridia bacterium]|nr:P35 family lipoprotein [Clostridia bacterium]
MWISDRYRTYTTIEQGNAGGSATAAAGGGTWGKFASGIYSNYLDAPANVDYQEKESYVELMGETGPNYNIAFNFSNEAYGTPTVENYFKGGVNNNMSDRSGVNTNFTSHAADSKNASGTTISIDSNHKAGYEDWQNDKVWLPSVTETGYTPDGGIWGLSNDQRINFSAAPQAKNAMTWLRSGYVSSANSAYNIKVDGGFSSTQTYDSLAVRPAVHLNLTKAQADSDITEVPVPQDITVDYDGSAKWLNSLDTTTDTSGNNYAFKWIDATLHTDTSIVTVKKIEYTDYDALGAQVTANKDVTSSGTANIRNAGKYEVTLEIPSTSTEYEWRGGGTGEKKFTITINQKAVPYTLQFKKGSTVVTAVTYGDSFTHEVVQTAVTSLPTDIYELLYAGTGSTSYTASTTAPTEAGTYSLTLKVKDDPNNAGKKMPSNYKLTGSAASLKIDPKKLDIPTVTAPQEYSGSALTFVLADFNSGTYISMDGVAAANGSTVTGASGAALTDASDTFEATKVDVYTVTLSLRDTANYVWEDNTNTSKTIDFKVTQKELLSSAPVSSAVNGIGNAEWEYGDSTVTVTVTDDRISGETLNLIFYYDNKSNTLTNVTATGNVAVISIPSDIAVGSHTLYVDLNGTTGDNANYQVTAYNTLDFEITSGRIDPSTYGWIYTKDGAAGSTIKDGDKLPFELKAGSTTDGVKYEVSIQIPAAHTSVVVDTSKYASGYQLRSGDSVNTYVTKVALKSTDPTFEFEDASGNKTATIEVTLSWEIEKGTFDLSAVKWEYSLDGSAWADYDPANPPQYNDGNYITVRVKASTLPLGLTLDSLYAGNEEYDVDTYTATISASDLKYNTTNFNAPNTSLLDLNWEIAKKNLFTGFKNVKDTYSNANGSGTIILKQLNIDPMYDSYITYKYYDLATGLEVTLADIKAAADPTHEKKYKVEAHIDPAFASNFAVEASDGSVPSDTFVTGSKNKLATVTIDGNDGSTPITAVYDTNDHFDTSLIKITGDDGINVTDFTVTYYKGNSPVAGNELAAGELPKDAGEYCIAVTLGAIAEKKYILATDWFTVKVEPKGIEVPTLGEMVFNGKELVFENFLGGSWNDYKSIIELNGKLSDRNVGAGDYVTTLKLTDTNYKWVYPAKAKSTAGYALTADVVPTGDEVTATYNWNITPLIVDTTNMWNKGKKGATLNLPQNIKDLIAGGTLDVGYRYYDGDGQLLESPEIKGGKSFKVEAVFGGDDAERNVQFLTGDNEFGATSKSVDYTVPQSGIAAFGGKVLSFLKNNWWWLLIALAILILLIILIVVLVKRRKNKEEREEKKRQKEEEKERREEEKRRREEEREAERERQRQELELAKAKQEAELAKMKAEAAAAAGIAATAVAAQPQQEVAPAPVQQPQHQVQYVQQQPTVDPNALARIEAELAALRAENRANQHNNNSMPMAQPMMMPVQQPMMQMPMPMMQQPTYGPMPSYGGNGGGDINQEIRARLAEERARTAEDRLFRTTEQRAILAEDRLARGGNNQMPVQQPMYMQAQPVMQQPAPQPVQTVYVPTPQVQQANNGNADAFGAVLASMFKTLTDNNVKLEKKSAQEVTQVIETESQPTAVNAPTVYPPDAVVTTTTTVDTTKNKAQPRAVRSDDGRLFDIDGFYDTFEGNK